METGTTVFEKWKPEQQISKNGKPEQQFSKWKPETQFSKWKPEQRVPIGKFKDPKIKQIYSFSIFTN